MPKWKRVLSSAVAGYDRLNVTLSYIAGAIVMGMIFSICYEIVMRYFLNRPTRWVVETTEFMLVFICFLSAAWILGVDGHVRMDLILNRLNKKRQTIMNIFTSFMGLVYVCFLMWATWAWAWESLLKGTRFNTVLQEPMFPILIVIPIGCLLLALQFIRKIAGYIISIRSSE